MHLGFNFFNQLFDKLLLNVYCLLKHLMITIYYIYKNKDKVCTNGFFSVGKNFLIVLFYKIL